MYWRSFVGLSVAAFLSASAAFGSAFAVNELGGRAQGMGGAFTSVADDGSAIFFNPAGLAFQKGWQFQMDLLIVAGQFRFVPSNPPPGTVVPQKGFPGAVSTPFIPVPSMYISKDLNSRVTLGFGAYTPFGLAANFTNFNDSDPAHTKYTGRWAGTRAALQSYFFQPTVGIRLTENLAFGVGVAFVHTHLFLEQSFLNPLDKPDDFGRSLAREIFPNQDPDLAFRSFSRLLPEGRLRAAATANKYAVTGGLLYKHKPSRFNFGLSYRTAVVNHLKGDAAFAFTGGGSITPFLPSDRTLPLLFRNQPISGTLVTPAAFTGGISTDRFLGATIAFDVRVQDFRRFVDLPLNFSLTQDEKGRDLATPAERRLEFDFRDSILIHTGIEKPLGDDGWGPGMLRKFTRAMTVRGGYVFDRSPVVDKSVGPLFPDANRHSMTLGMTKSIGNKDFTLFYQMMQFINRTTNVPSNAFQGTNGEYRNFAHLAGMTMRLRPGRNK